jgi:tRNA (cmo5U34)-methyltransferase
LPAQLAEQIKIINDSYLTVDLHQKEFDYVISVMTFHHLLYSSKKNLYTKICKSLKVGGKYIEGDYIVSEEKEKILLEKFELSNQNKSIEDGFFHIDIPFSLKTEKELLNEAGFHNFNLIFKKDEVAVYVLRKEE